MEIVLLYKFYIFSFLNLKEGRKEGGKEGSKLCAEAGLQSTAASREMARTSRLNRRMEDAARPSEGHRGGI